MSAEFNKLMVSQSANALEVAELSEFIENQLYFMVLSNNKDSTTLLSFKDWKTSVSNNVYYLNVDDNLVYDSFFNDFGPMNLAMVYRYIGILQEIFKVHKTVVHCTHKGDQKKLSNSAFLICSYMIIEKNWTAYQTYKILSQEYKHQYMSFRDASCLLQSDYSVTLEECINALYKAKWYGFFNFDDFDVEEYEKYETVKYGDINWIVPSTLLAFSSPHTRDFTDKSGYQIHSPAYYYQYFKENNVKHIVRLNSKKTYDAKRTFVAIAHIQHTDMIFTDGTSPSDSILNSFLCLCEQYIDENAEGVLTNNEMNESSIQTTTNTNINTKASTAGAVAVHCKAGLGRTGCLIASYIVKHWSFTAIEAIAWIRICRPGSVIGVQQKWLTDKEEYLKAAGKQWREIRKMEVHKYKQFTRGVYSIKRHTSQVNICNYIDPPLQSSISSEVLQPGCSKSDIEHVQSKEKMQSRFSSVLKKKLKTTDVQVSNQRPKRSSVKNEDSKLKSTLSTIRNIRRATNSTVEINMNSLVKKNNTSNPKASTNGKKNTKIITLNKTSTRPTRTSTPTEMTAKIKEETKPSYALATVASSARISKRIRNQNAI